MLACVKLKGFALPKTQQGAVLIISLLLLMVMSLLGVSIVQVTSLEEKMAGNSKDQNLAFQAAEMALRAGEARIETIRKSRTGIQAFCNNTPGLFKSPAITVGGVCATSIPDPNASSTWTDASKSIAVDIGKGLGTPRYFITYTSFRAAVGSGLPTYGFMITARGSGVQSTTHVILRSYYGGEVKFP